MFCIYYYYNPLSNSKLPAFNNAKFASSFPDNPSDTKFQIFSATKQKIMEKKLTIQTIDQSGMSTIVIYE